MQIANRKSQNKEADHGFCHLLIDPPAAGAWNMGVDEVLLGQAADEGVATLRFYQWCEPTLSLGYFQRYEDRRLHAASQACAVVRRQSGGGAILHDRELTYSIALPAGHRLARNAEALYGIVHNAFVDELRPLLASANGGWSLRIRERGIERLARDEPFLCFQRRARRDVVLEKPAGAEANEIKILGSAQRRLRGAILQHGSLLLETSPAAPELTGFNEITGAVVSPAELAERMATRLAGIVGVTLQKSQLPTEIQLAFTAASRNKYESPVWTKRR